MYYKNATAGWVNLTGGGSSSGATVTVEVSGQHCVYHTINSCICPTSFYDSPGPIPAEAKVISCSTADFFYCFDSTGMGANWIEAGKCSASISGNMINVVISPPSGSCDFRAVDTTTTGSCGGTSCCTGKYSSATVTYSY
jgi:hypothetical protein